MSWPRIRLGEVSELVYGKGLRDYKDEQDDEHPARVFGTNGPIGWAKQSLIEQPTVIVGRKGAYRGIHFSDTPSWTIDTAFYTTVDPDRMNMRWFYYRMLLVDINGMNSGAAIPSTRREDFYSLDVQVPDLESQRRMVSVLSAYDDFIENNRRRIVLLEAAARTLYREWFTYFRFPGHEHVKMVDGIPEGWERRRLGQIITLKRGYDLPENSRAAGKVPVVSSAGTTGLHKDHKVISPGVVTGRYGTLGEVYYMTENFWPLNTTLYVKDFHDIPSLMAYHFLKNHLKGVVSQKAAVPGLDRNVLHADVVIWPPRKLQDDYVDIVTDYQEQLRVLHAMNRTLAEARDLLLPRLMSGETAL